jgi:hypothetical protein
MKFHKATWGKSLKISTILGSIGLTFTSLLMWLTAPSNKIVLIIGAIPLLIVIGCALFTIRGYSVTPDELLIHRLIWKTRLKRRNLKSAKFDPDFGQQSRRTFGNNGLFSYSGLYWNSHAGYFHAYFTNWDNCIIILSNINGIRPSVISPSNPGNVVQELNL